jgi:hypothetical protein
MGTGSEISGFSLMLDKNLFKSIGSPVAETSVVVAIAVDVAVSSDIVVFLYVGFTGI